MTELAEEVIKNLPIDAFEEDSKEQEVLEFLKSRPPVPYKYDGLLSCFNGSDILAFFDGDLQDVMHANLTKREMVAHFVLGPKSAKIALGKDPIKYYFIGINEQGYAGLISGNCTPQDFNIRLGIDELSIEVVVSFSSCVQEIVGWVGGDRIAQEIVREKLKNLYEGYMRNKGAYK